MDDPGTASRDRVRLVLLAAIAFTTVLLVAAATMLVIIVQPPPRDLTHGRAVLLESLEPGDCILRFTPYPLVDLSLTVVDCDVPHGAELVFMIDGAESTRPSPASRRARSWRRRAATSPSSSDCTSAP